MNELSQQKVEAIRCEKVLEPELWRFLTQSTKEVRAEIKGNPVTLLPQGGSPGARCRPWCLKTTGPRSMSVLANNNQQGVERQNLVTALVWR